MPIAREGLREIIAATLFLGVCAVGALWLAVPTLLVPFVIVWLWVLSFFRDPKRERSYAAGELCAPADGTVTEITALDEHESIGGPAYRIGVFLSLFSVHINRAPCAGKVLASSYRPGRYLNARNPESGARNESNTLLIAPTGSIPGPVEVRQVAGLLARRIVCHAEVNDYLSAGARFGLIKFGSRTELIIPRREETEITVKVGDKVRAGLTIVARQPVEE